MAAAAAGALMVVVLASNLLGSWRVTPRFNLPIIPAKGTPPQYTPPPAPTAPQMSGLPSSAAEPLISQDAIDTILRVVVVIVALAAAVFVAGLLWRLRRPEPTEAEAAAPQVSVHEAVRDAVQTARSYLRRTRETGDAVASIIGAWSALEEAAAESGHRRRPEHTPSEFTADLLASVSGAEREIQALLGLYHRARYGSAAVIAGLTRDDADRAGELLEAIADQMDDQPDAAFRRPRDDDRSEQAGLGLDGRHG